MKIAVYTCIVGGKDSLKDAPNETGVPCYCYTDSVTEVKEDKGWILIPIDSSDTPRKTNRWYKTHPHKLKELKDVDYTIYVDGSILLLKCPESYINALESTKKDMLVVEHWKRNCAYEEAKECIKEKLDTKGNITTMVDKLTEFNWPKNSGLSCGGFLVRKNDLKTMVFNLIWWEHIDNYSIRDQLSLDFCAHHAGVTISRVKKEDTYKLGGHLNGK